MVMQANKEAYIMRGNNSFELPNPLHKFASYNTIFTLSGVTEKEIRDGDYLIAPLHDVVARTGGIGPDGFRSAYRDEEIERDGAFGPTGEKTIQRLRGRNARYAESISVLERNHDVFIENVNILSTISPNTERNLSNFTKMEFEVHEPYSITFIEKVRAATFNSGFLDYQDAPLLLTIEFKGFDENGKAIRNGMSETRKIPIIIVRVDFDVNEGGATYSIVAVPYGDLALDDRFKVLRTRVDLTKGNWTGWKTALESALEKQMDQEIEEKVRQYPDKYRIEVDSKLLNNQLREYAFSGDSLYAGKTVKDDTEDQVGAVEEIEGGLGGGKQTQTVDVGTTITKAMEDWFRNYPGFFDLSQDFWRSYLTMAGYKLPENEKDRTLAIRDLLTNKDRETELQALFLKYQYVPWFKIKTSVYTDTSKLDAVTKMHPKELVYKAIPYKIHVLKLLTNGLSIGKVRWDKLVRKNYDFIYTGDNVDVQNLRINYKSAYYMRNVRGEDKTENESGFKRVVSSTAQLVFGREDYPEPLLPLRSYPSNIKGRSTVENFRPGGNKSQEFFDYLTNPEADMMRIELDILGDPHYIAADVLACLKRINDKKTEEIIKIDSDFDDNRFGSFNADKYMTLINLRYRLPADINERKGLMFADEQTRDESLFFNGVYQVVKVDSKFNQGQFTQTLTCVRMNNQQGEGAAPQILTSSLGKYFGKDNKKPRETVGDKINKNIGDEVDEQIGNLNEV